MCGRTACTLGKEDIRRACCYKDGHGKFQRPDWRESPNGAKYYPCQNIAPTRYTPVIVSRSHFADDTALTTDRVIQPMYWGLVPFWFKGELKSLANNNARSESVLEKRSFSVPLKKGQRCVVVAEGYYEWHTDKGQKQPHLIYFPQAEGNNVEDHSDLDMEDLWTEDKGWLGPRMLTMAGIFEVCNHPEDENPLYSYCILTMESSTKVSWIHERMPVILDGEDAINSWLDYGKVPLEEAMKLVVASENLASHPVSSAVNNSRNKGPECMKPMELKAVKTSGVMNWLKTGKMETKFNDEGSPRKIKVELKSPVKKDTSPQKTLTEMWGSPKRKPPDNGETDKKRIKTE